MSKAVLASAGIAQVCFRRLHGSSVAKASDTATEISLYRPSSPHLSICSPMGVHLMLSLQAVDENAGVKVTEIRTRPSGPKD
jgi:hypothetical protein